MQAVFGYLRKYPSADVIFINYLLSIFYKNDGWLWGGKLKIPTGIIRWSQIRTADRPLPVRTGRLS